MFKFLKRKKELSEDYIFIKNEELQKQYQEEILNLKRVSISNLENALLDNYKYAIFAVNQNNELLEYSFNDYLRKEPLMMQLRRFLNAKDGIYDGKTNIKYLIFYNINELLSLKNQNDFKNY